VNHKSTSMFGAVDSEKVGFPSQAALAPDLRRLTFLSTLRIREFLTLRFVSSPFCPDART